MHYVISDTQWSALARVTAGNVEKSDANCCAIFDTGETILSVTGTVTSGVATTLGGLGTSHDKKSFVWYVHAAAAAESLTARFTITTSHGQTLIFAVDYVVTVPS